MLLSEKEYLLKFIPLYDIMIAIIRNDLRVVPSNKPQNRIITKWLFELENKFNIKIDQYIIMAKIIF